MKKVLIYMPINEIQPKGGPAGYLYNLNNSLKSIKNNIDFLPPTENKNNKKENLKKMVPKRVLEFLRAIKFTKLISQKEEISKEYLEYDIIHFHCTTDLYKCKDSLEEYNGKVVLTSHSPCAYHIELLNRLNNFDKKIFKNKLKSLEEIDKYAFQRADYIIFPCKEAEEPYYNSWSEYKNIRDEKKIRYLYTGIEECKAKEKPKDIRAKYGLKDNDFVLCYVGRHNEIKGYDSLIINGLKAIDELNCKMLVAGKNEPIVGPKNNNWIEIGWTKDPHSIINAADVFVLPNKETYFDLVMLEVLSLGKIILTTYTGGNKIFKDFDGMGVFYYKDTNDFIEKLKYIKSLSAKEKRKYEEKNIEIYKKYFTSEKFAKDYIKLIDSLK